MTVVSTSVAAKDREGALLDVCKDDSVDVGRELRIKGVDGGKRVLVIYAAGLVQQRSDASPFWDALHPSLRGCQDVGYYCRTDCPF